MLYVLAEVVVGVVGFAVLANLTGNYESAACRAWVWCSMAIAGGTAAWQMLT